MPEQGDARTWLTIEEVGASLEINHQTVRRYIREKKLRASKIGGRWRVRPEDLQRFLDQSSNMEVPAA